MSNFLTRPLRSIAYARSGDKGSNSNIGLIAFTQAGYNFLLENVSCHIVHKFFQPLGVQKVERFPLPNLFAINFVLTNALDGGGSLSLRLDNQGKALGQALLEMNLKMPIELIISENLPRGGEKELISLKKLGSDIAILTLNRPERRNALNVALLESLCCELELLFAEKKIRALILRGEGPCFCAGLDLNEATNPDLTDHSARLLSKLYRLVHSAPFFTIAAVHGAAIAGGAALMICCDYAIATETTKISFPEVQKGLIPAMVVALLKEQLGLRNVRELTLLAEKISVEKALSLGLINCIVSEQELLKTALNIAQKSLHSAPHSLTQTKYFVNESFSHSFEENMQQALVLQQQSRKSEEASEGIKAFFEERPPSWQEHVNE